ncbi:uncharacterized protein V6R79_003152 [Siganus canaliculatus]
MAFAKCHNNQSLPVRRILDMFPCSHHRPSLITIPSLVHPVPGRDVKRWNFRNANWAGFTKQLNMAAPDLPHPCPNNLNDAYDLYCNILLDATKNNIPVCARPTFPAGTRNVNTFFVIIQKHKLLKSLKLPKIWHRSKVIALPKPNRPSVDPKGYWLVSLLCVPFKLLERLILTRLTPVINRQLPKEQAGFRSGRSTTDQVTLLCHDIEESFQAGEKTGAVFLDLTAAYDTVWLRGLHMKLLETIPDKHMVSFIMNMRSNCSFRATHQQSPKQ